MTIQIKKYYCSLSEAIRAGSLLRPQCAGKLFTLTKSCALGAGYEAVTGLSDEPTDSEFREFQDLYAATFAMRPPCPVDKCRDCSFDDLGFVVTHLNDYHTWAREQIADWLYAEEEKLGFITITTEEETEASPVLSLEITTAPKNCPASFTK